MFKLWKKKDEDAQSGAQPLTWDDKAKQALEQALAQAPVPGPLKGKVRRELERAAEEEAKNSKSTTVTAEHLMKGFLAKMPAGMRAKVEAAMQQGPEGLEKLKDELQK